MSTPILQLISLRRILKDILPPLAMKGWRRLRMSGIDGVKTTDITFTGDYASWTDAQCQSVGYDSTIILQKTREALLAVKHGEAAFERDSVIFEKPEYTYPLIAALLRAVVRSDGRLSVLDFGGSLGSSYFQCRKFLDVIPQLEWLVVEQKTHVDCGRRDFQSEQLRFFYSVEEVLVLHKPNVLLLSSVLQYLPDPYEVLVTLLGHRIDNVIIDRTGFLERNRDRLTVQHVPSTIYSASYPAWFLSESKLLEILAASNYILVTDYDAIDTLTPVDEKAYYKGFVFEQSDCDHP